MCVMDHASVSELLGAYALDACDNEETAAVEAHLASCPSCADEASRLKELAGWIGVTSIDVNGTERPSSLLRQRTLQEALRDDPPGPPPPTRATSPQLEPTPPRR
jgi:anti-sigma factor RsiW